MRLIATIIMIIAAILWLPWFLLLIRLIIDLAMGTPWDYSNYVKPVLMGFWPDVGMGLWPLSRLFLWRVHSIYPILAVMGVGLSAIGWRIYWREQDGILSRTALMVGLSIAFPVLAPFFMWGDAKKRHNVKEVALETYVDDARERVEPE